MRIHPRQIEAFRAAIITGSVTAAANLIGITQPAVSRLIRDLEAETRLTLFTRSGNRIVPTTEAALFFQEVDRFYLGLEYLGGVAERLSRSESGSLRVASSYALANTCVIRAVMQMMTEAEGLDLSMDGLDSKDILNLTAIGHYDIGLVPYVSSYPGLNFSPLPQVPAVCAAHRSSPLARKEVVGPEDLREVPFISIGRNTSTRLKIDGLLANRNVRPRHLLETSLAATAMIMIDEGVGAAVVDPFTGLYANKANVVWRPFVPTLTLDASLVTPGHKPKSLLTLKFEALIIDAFNSIISLASPPDTDAVDGEAES